MIAAIESDSTDIASIFYESNTFIYYLTAHHFGGPKFDEPSFEDLVDRIAMLSSRKTGLLAKNRGSVLLGEGGADSA